MAFLTPLIGWGFIAAILTWSQAHEQLDSHWLIKSRQGQFWRLFNPYTAPCWSHGCLLFTRNKEHLGTWIRININSYLLIICCKPSAAKNSGH